MASLTSVPLELLIMVSSHLSTRDLGSLRRTCKTIEKALFDSFAKEFFTKKQFMFTQPSLQALVDISKHPQLSKQLSHVIFGTEQYKKWVQPMNGAPRNTTAKARYLQGYCDQLTLMNTGFDRELLTEAFLNLPNLQTMGIRDSNTRRRPREPNTMWSSYGLTTVFEETHDTLTPGASHFTSHIFATILYALGKARSTPPVFEVILRSQGLPEYALNVSAFLSPVLSPVLQGLKGLLLDLDMTGRVDGFCLGAFLTQTPNLTHLRLNFQQHLDCLKVIHWFADLPPSPPNSPMGSGPTPISWDTLAPVSFPYLRRLDFGKMRIESALLLKVLAKLVPTLKELSLFRVTLDAPPNIIFSRPYDESQNLWAGLLASLTRIPALSLECAVIGFVSQRDHRVSYRVQFTEATSIIQGHADSALQATAVTSKAEIKYCGRDTMVLLKNLVERKWIRVEWPPEPEISSDSDDEEMHDDFEDEEHGEMDDE
jgi:hypothetical protein